MKRFLPFVVFDRWHCQPPRPDPSAPSSLWLRSERSAFLKHGHLMEKPALKNERACWQSSCVPHGTQNNRNWPDDGLHLAVRRPCLG